MSYVISVDIMCDDPGTEGDGFCGDVFTQIGSVHAARSAAKRCGSSYVRGLGNLCPDCTAARAKERTA